MTPKRVVVTGGSGFVGQHTLAALRAEDIEVFNYDLVLGYDVRSLAQLRTVLRSDDRVLHLAAISRFADADADPLLAFETNVLGCENVAKVCREKGIEKLVYSSTGSVYMPILDDPPIVEDFPARGNSVYGCTKNLGELMIKRTGVPYVILRYAHLYGEGRRGGGAIGSFVDRVKRGIAPILYGGRQSNDFTYIADVVQANILALETAHIGEIFNVGTGEELTIEEVFQSLGEHLDYRGEIERLPSRTVDSPRFVYDISKARKLLSYSPKFSFQDGLTDWGLEESRQ